MNGRIIVIDVKFHNNMYRLINIYAPNHPLERETFFQNTVNNLADCNHEKIVGGDYNCTLNPLIDRGECDHVKQVAASPPMNQDWMKPIIADKGANVLLEMMEARDVEDVWRRRNPDMKKFTWSHHGKNVASRIDYWLISRSLDPYAKQIDIVDNVFSDHAAIVLSLKLSDIVRGKGYWKMNNHIIATKRFQDIFENWWQEWVLTKNQYSSVRQWWDLTKKKIKQLTIWCAVQMNDESRNELKFLEKQLQLVGDNCERKRIETEIKQIHATKTEGARVRSRVNWHENGESSTAYFYNLEKRKGKEKLWDGILDCDGNMLYGTEKILERQVQFYKELYKSQDVCEEEMVNFLTNLKAKLSEPSVVYLDSQITATELSKAVQQMKANKSPGPDGITPEFYKQYWDKIKGVFLEVVRDIYDQDELSYTQYQAIISLLYKKGIRENIIN